MQYFGGFSYSLSQLEKDIVFNEEAGVAIICTNSFPYSLLLINMKMRKFPETELMSQEEWRNIINGKGKEVVVPIEMGRAIWKRITES